MEEEEITPLFFVVEEQPVASVTNIEKKTATYLVIFQNCIVNYELLYFYENKQQEIMNKTRSFANYAFEMALYGQRYDLFMNMHKIITLHSKAVF